jgi:YfiH family protein
MTDAALAPLTSPKLSALPGIKHGFFTREGGVSTGVYTSLNTGVGSKDDPDAVHENRRRIAAHFGAEAQALVTPYQIHSATALTVVGPWSDHRREGDAVVTSTAGVICGALAADCAPVLLADPEARVVAAAHAGWKGALGGITDAAIAAMVKLGASPDRVVAVVGPCIGPNSYEVGLEFVDTFEAQDPGAARFFHPGAGAEKRMFDLPAYVLHRLERAGVRGAVWLGRDTCAEEELFFSNRRAFKSGEPDYGRLLSTIALV